MEKNQYKLEYWPNGNKKIEGSYSNQLTFMNGFPDR